MWPSFTYAPVQLVRTMAGSRPWGRIEPLQPEEKVEVAIDSQTRLPAQSKTSFEVVVEHSEPATTESDGG
jgi:hypothetical protein